MKDRSMMKPSMEGWSDEMRKGRRLRKPRRGNFLFIYAHAARHGQPSRLGRNDTRHSHFHSVGHLARSSQGDVGPPSDGLIHQVLEPAWRKETWSPKAFTGPSAHGRAALSEREGCYLMPTVCNHRDQSSDRG
jgi:hypothetical protein